MRNSVFKYCINKSFKTKLNFIKIDNPKDQYSYITKLDQDKLRFPKSLIS